MGRLFLFCDVFLALGNNGWSPMDIGSIINPTYWNDYWDGLTLLCQPKSAVNIGDGADIRVEQFRHAN